MAGRQRVRPRSARDVRRVSAVVLGLVVVGWALAAPTGAAGTPGGAGAAGTAGTGVPAWLEAVNFYRGVAKLPPVAEDPTLSAHDVLHAHYIVNAGLYQHYEDPTVAGYSAEGDDAGRHSDIQVADRTRISDQQAVDGWITAPFHAFEILDPALVGVGYGAFREAGHRPYAFAAALDVGHDLADAAPPSVGFPVRFPGPNSTVNLQVYPGHESPDPLTSCPGSSAPTGLPILIQFAGPTTLTSATVSDRGRRLATCTFDATTYTNPEPADQANGRADLAAFHGAVVIPRTPLLPGHRYDVTVDAPGQHVAWSFTVGHQDLPFAAPAGSAGSGSSGVDLWQSFLHDAYFLVVGGLVAGVIAWRNGPGPDRRRQLRVAWVLSAIATVWVGVTEHVSFPPPGSDATVYFGAVWVGLSLWIVGSRVRRRIRQARRLRRGAVPARDVYAWRGPPTSGGEGGGDVRPPRSARRLGRRKRPAAAGDAGVPERNPATRRVLADARYRTLRDSRFAELAVAGHTWPQPLVREGTRRLVCADYEPGIVSHVTLWEAGRDDLGAQARAALVLATEARDADVHAHLANCVVPVLQRLLTYQHLNGPDGAAHLDAAGELLGALVAHADDLVDGQPAHIESEWVNLLRNTSFTVVPTELEPRWAEHVQQAYARFCDAQEHAVALEGRPDPRGVADNYRAPATRAKILAGLTT